MSFFRKLTLIILTSAFVLDIVMFSGAIAAVYPDSPVPGRVRVEADSGAPIGYNEFEGNYGDIKWDALNLPPEAGNGYVNFYLQEIAKPYKPSKPIEQVQGNLPDAEPRSLRVINLNSGTVYYVNSKSYYTAALDGGATYTSGESIPSNTARLLTDIDISAISHGANQIKLTWDDVWYKGQRINYRLYVSEDKNFANTPPIYIAPQNIGPNGPVTVDETNGNLEYVYTVNDPGRVYFIKIAPEITDPELKKNNESKTVAVSSKILARVTKMSSTSFGTIWRLDWSPVIAGLSSSGVKISYSIYKGMTNSNDLPQYVATVDDTSFFVTVAQGEESSYYIINASVTLNGQDVYPGIKIQSDKITVEESEVPSIPPVPELADSFKNNSGDVIISYDGELEPDSAAVLLKLPLKGNGETDTNTTYDVWLITDPNQIIDPPDSTKIASGYTMTQLNRIMDGQTLKGYKYLLDNLEPNTTYYFKIAARKTYVEYLDEVLQNVTYVSQSATKVIITPAEGPIDRPVAPGAPPLEIKMLPSGRAAVSDSAAVIQLKNKWYEKYSSETGKWEHKTPEELAAEGMPNVDIVHNLENNVPEEEWPEKNMYRIVEYDPGVTIDVGVIPYEENMTYNELYNIPSDWVTGFPTSANDPDEEEDDNPDGEAHNINITLDGLAANVTYIVWVRASRLSEELVSAPSDPIIVTTRPIITDQLEKPTVPVFNYYFAGDSYVNLGWTLNPKYNYYIKYGIEDNIDQAGASMKIAPADMLFRTWYRISGLETDTLYYFWIQAEAVNDNGGTSQSQWSDSYPVKTLPDIPPSTPGGFGVKGAQDAITKDTIAYEWITKEGMEYFLEIADNIDYQKSTEYQVGEETEYTVNGLRSNYRYYARLYAYNPENELRSEPTQSVAVRTLRSSDDYDSDEDIENPVTGDFIVKDPFITDRTWNVEILGVNADRFIQHAKNDGRLDYVIDASSPPSKADKVSVTVSSKVFDGLSSIKENLIIKTVKGRFIIRPEVFALSGRQGEFNYNILFNMSASDDDKASGNLIFKTDIMQLQITSDSGGNSIFLKSLNRPLKVEYDYLDENWYSMGRTSAYYSSDGISAWDELNTGASYERDAGRGYVSFETGKTGYIVIADTGNSYFDDINLSWTQSSINRVASVHELKSLSGRKFEPDRTATNGDAVKLMLDILEYDYDSRYMEAAAKAGIINSKDAGSSNSTCTREEAIAMAVRVYELKSGERAWSYGSNSVFNDISNVNPVLRNKIAFAEENGIIISRFRQTLGPKDAISRGEIMVLLEKVMALAGEID